MKNKGKKILGMPLAIFIIGLMVIGGASAALVGYLSNTATVSQAVESPMTVQFAEDYTSALSSEAWSDTLTLPGTTGLSTSELGLKLVNNADVDISDEVLEITVGNTLKNVDCEDLTSLTFFDVGASESSGNHIVQQLAGVGLCTDNGKTITYKIPINLIQAKTNYRYPVTLTYGNVAPDTYTFSAQMMDI